MPYFTMSKSLCGLLGSPLVVLVASVVIFQVAVPWGQLLSKPSTVILLFHNSCFDSLAELSRLLLAQVTSFICFSKARFCCAALLHPLCVLSGVWKGCLAGSSCCVLFFLGFLKAKQQETSTVSLEWEPQGYLHAPADTWFGDFAASSNN